MSLNRLEYWLTTPISVLWRDVQDGQISNKLVRVFVLQMLAISMAAALGGWVATLVVERVLVKQSLDAEAQYFWQQRRQNPRHPLPDTYNLIGYLAVGGDQRRVPLALRQEQVGYRRINIPRRGQLIVHITRQSEDWLYLTFDQGQVTRASFIFGVAPLVAALLVIYFLTWLGYISSKRALSPLVKLAERVESFDFRGTDIDDLNLKDIAAEADIETLSLLRAFEHFTQRLQTMLERERLFTRNASHELRTPIAVVLANLDLLQQRVHDPEQSAEIIKRMRRAGHDMQGLIETLLLLARDDHKVLNRKTVNARELAQRELEMQAAACAHPGVTHALITEQQLLVEAPERVVSMVFANLLRNAFTYTTSGHVDVIIRRRSVVIQDTGIGMSPQDLDHAFEPFFRGGNHSDEGYGLGLALVARLCQNYGWKIKADSVQDRGTEVTIVFPESSWTQQSGSNL